MTTDSIFLANGDKGSRPGSRHSQGTDSSKSGNTVPDDVTDLLTLITNNSNLPRSREKPFT